MNLKHSFISNEVSLNHEFFVHLFLKYICRNLVSFVYYGLLLNTENLSGDIFLNFFFGALVEVPAYVMCMLFLNRFGRKKLYIAFMLIGGISGISTIFPLLYASDGKKTSSSFSFSSKSYSESIK